MIILYSLIMSSSDSDDCYGNIAQKLQTLKDKVQEKIFVDNPLPVTNSDLSKTDTNTNTTECNTTLDSSDDDELTLDAIKTKEATTNRGRKRKTANSGPESSAPLSTQRVTRRKTANSNAAESTLGSTTVSNEDVIDVVETSTTRRGRGRSTVSEEVTDTSLRGSTTARGSTRGRGRGATPRRRGRGRNRRTIPVRDWFSNFPIYSIGNTDEYPDLCDNQQLFSTNPSKNNEVEIIEDEDPLANDNEEMSVKVYWQSLEVVRFKIRKYQKLTPVFKYFSERENVGTDKLLFMYNERILKVDDTPDSIDYSIAKFIDGGIVEQDVTGLVKQNSRELKGGLKIKFQCQNVKKPFETTIRPEDKLALAMMKCSEHLETPLERLKFYFDGDLISSKSTVQDLDLEGGECIDVKICS